MGDNLPALVNAGSNFRILTLTGNHRAGLSGVGPQGMDSQPIFTNVDFDRESTVWQFLVSIQDAMLTLSAVVGNNPGGYRRQRFLSAQGRRVWQHRARNRKHTCNDRP